MKIKNYFLIVSLFSLCALSGVLSSCSDIEEPSSSILLNEAPAIVITKEITASQAQKVAKIFSSKRLGISESVASRSAQSIETICDGEGKALAYVVNTYGEGWVIVSALRSYFPILAYSDNSDDNFTLTDKTIKESGLSIWIAEMKEAISHSENLDSITTASIAYEWLQYEPQISPTSLPDGNDEAAVACRNRLKELNETYYKAGWTFKVLTSVSEVTIPSSIYTTADICGSPYQYTIIGLHDVSIRSEVSPLISTLWSQGNPYNALCNGALAGCVPIAMAQIMKFHNYPNNYIWTNMPNKGATTDTQKLIFDIGTNVGITYDPQKDSGADGNDAVNGFKKMGYTATKNSFMISKVTQEIATYKRPVFLRGRDTSKNKGHAWVCDGYVKKVSEYEYYVEYLNSVGEYTNFGETLLENPGSLSGQSYATLHMNWGAGGDYNGYYMSPTPDDYNFSYNYEYIFVKPNL